MAVDVALYPRDFDSAEELSRFAGKHPGAGGLASFVGQVRDDGDTKALELQHYAPLTEAGITALAEKLIQRFELAGILVRHRTGTVQLRKPVVLVAAAAAHRREAFEAVDCMMDHLKSAAWFWKREQRGGNWQWIAPTVRDHADLDRWK